MSKQPKRDPVSEYLAGIGRKGGKASTPAKAAAARANAKKPRPGRRKNKPTES